MDFQAMARPVALVVEDDALQALEIEDLLVAEGFKTVVAYSWAEAVQVMPDCLTVAIVDINLAGELVGQRIIQSLRCTTPDLPIVVVTGYHRTFPEADLRGLGWPTIRLEKPVGIHEVASALWDVIEQMNNGAQLVGGRRFVDRDLGQQGQ